MSPVRSLNKEVLRLALPSILANITVPLVGIVDTAIVGHVASSTAIGGIAIGTMLFDLLYWNFGFLRVGTAGMTAQAYGRHKAGKANDETPEQILIQSASIAIVAALAIWLIQWFFVETVLYFVPCSDEVSSFSKQYFYIRIWAAPATLSLMTLKGWFIGMQDTRAAMITDLTVNIVNMLASYILAVHTSLGAIGVAHGTLVAQYVGLAVAILLLLRKKIHVCTDDIKQSLHWEKIKRLLSLNGNLFIRSLCFMIIYVGFTSLSSKYGDNELALSSIIMKIFMLFSYLIDGFAYAGEALVGRFIGEHDRKSMLTSVKLLFVWTIAIGIVSTVFIEFADDIIFRFMTSDADLLSAASSYKIWLLLMPLMSCLAFMWDGVFIGATRGIELRNSMIYAAIGFVVCYIALQGVWGIQALYLAYFVHLAVRSIYLSYQWFAINDRICAN